MLEHNLSVIHSTNVTCHNGDAIELLPELEQDIIFFDPPWGGPEYKSQSVVDIFLSGKSMAEICESVKDKVTYVVLKLPNNFNLEPFRDAVSAVKIDEHRLHKMLLLILHYPKSTDPRDMDPAQSEEHETYGNSKRLSHTNSVSDDEQPVHKKLKEHRNGNED